MSRSIIITEGQLHKIINEGAEWKPNDDNTVNLSINSSPRDIDNSVGKTSVDTRVFGTKHDVLYGDDSFRQEKRGRMKNFNDSYNERLSKLSILPALKQWAENGCHGDVTKIFSLPKEMLKPVLKHLYDEEGNITQERFIDWCNTSISRYGFEQNLGTSIYSRFNNLPSDDARGFRYQKGVIPKTNVQFIALFTMKDFNFHAALKHGSIKSGNFSDKILGITQDISKKEVSRGKAKIPVDFDNNKTEFNIKNLFSQGGNTVDGVNHFKTQYGYKDPSYTSINQFFDKSIMYAARVLKEEGFSPTHIVSAPSSSEFNKYYCINLANKLGIKYVEDFFKKDALNININDKNASEELKNDGFSDKDILQFKTAVLGIYRYELKKKLKNVLSEFMDAYKVYFDSRTMDEMKEVVFKHILNNLLKNLNNTDTSNKYVGIHIATSIINDFDSTPMLFENSMLYTKEEMDERLLRQFQRIVNYKIGLVKFRQVVISISNLLTKNIDALATQKGIRLDVRKEDSKITGVGKRFRKYLPNIYIIADKYLTDGTLKTEFLNARFIIFDEDVNSGGTLALTTNALMNKLPDTHENNILGLVNAYSSSGF